MTEKRKLNKKTIAVRKLQATLSAKELDGYSPIENGLLSETISSIKHDLHIERAEQATKAYRKRRRLRRIFAMLFYKGK